MDASVPYSRIEAYQSLELIARQAVEGFITGLHSSPFHGFSVEFAEHRQYNTGESTRFIDWKLYGKTDKLFVKRFEEETNLRCHLMIDTSPSMYFPVDRSLDPDHSNKLVFSVYAAATLAMLMKKQRDAVSLTTFSDDIHLHSEARSSLAHQRYLFSELEKLLNSKPPVTGASHVAASLHKLSNIIHTRSLVIIFSDMMDQAEDQDAIFSALQHLKHDKHEVILFHVRDRQLEEELQYDNRPHRFVDMETGEVVRLNPAHIQQRYRHEVSARSTQLKQRCGAYGIDYFEADINKGFDGILFPYFMKRQKLF